MPKVSVVIATYNYGHFLGESIQSALDQTFRDFEIIVVDDGSTDNTREVVSSFADPRIKYIYQENQGASNSYNRGITLAEGEYIDFLDSDDVLIESALEDAVEILDEHPEVGFVYGQSYRMDEKGRIFGVKKPCSRHSHIRDGREEIAELILGNYITSTAVIVRRCFLEKIGGFDPNLRYGSVDFDLWVRLAKRCAVAYIAKPLTKYRVHSRAMSPNRRIKEIERSNSQILESVFNDAELGPILSVQRNNAYSQLYFRLAINAYHDHQDMETARHYLIKVVKTYPASLLKGIGPHWILLFVKTWIPPRVLASVRWVKFYLIVTARRILSLVPH